MVFMHDGAPCHRSASTLAFLDSRNVCLLSDWPEQSLDLNIIENMWAQVKMNTLKQQATSKDYLSKIVISLTFWSHLILSTPRPKLKMDA